MVLVNNTNTTSNAPDAMQSAIEDARPSYGTPVPTDDSRIVHVAPASLAVADIESAALTARQTLGQAEMADSRAASQRVNGIIIAHNARALFTEGEAAMISPGRSNHKARGRRNAVKRGFRFTVEGLDGIYKLNPLRRVA